MSNRRGLGLAVALLVVAGCRGEPAGSGPGERAGPSVLVAAEATFDSIGPSTPPAMSLPPTAEPTPEADPEPTPTPTPTATPRPDPSVAVLINGTDGDPPMIGIENGDTADIELSLVTKDVVRSDCTLRHRIDPDAPGIEPKTVDMKPLAKQTVALTDGWHFFTARCPSVDGPLKAEMAAVGADGLPERCAGFELPNGDVTVASLEELAEGMVGAWSGCVTTPWVPVYWVDVTFRADGSYSAVGGEVLDARENPALYYVDDAEHPDKRWRAIAFEEGLGIGEIDLPFSGGNVITNELGRIRLMDDALSFAMMHRGEYGPLVFRLVRS